MNIFILDNDIGKNVEYYIDVHVRKMLVESTQLLSTACRLSGLDIGYKVTHINHPCSKWVRQSLSNYKYLYELTFSLADEYYYRFNKWHKTNETLLQLPEAINIEDCGLTDFALALPDAYKCNDAILSYRNYYNGEKHYDKRNKNMFKWTKRNIPDWIII